MIYGDLLFAVNFSMDFLCLCAAGKLQRTRLRPLPLAAAAGVGGLYGTASVFFRMPPAASQAAAFAAALLSCFIAYERSGVAALLRRTGTFYLAGFILGGIMTAVYNAVGKKLGRAETIYGGAPAVLSRPTPLYFIIVAACAAGAAIFIFVRLLLRRGQVKKARIAITVLGRTAELDALCDSGNLCVEPISGRPVIFLTPRAVRRLVPENVARVMEGAGAEGAEALPRRYAARVRMVPVKTVTGSQIRTGLIPDAVRADCGERECCLVASPDSFGDEEALAPPIFE